MLIYNLLLWNVCAADMLSGLHNMLKLTVYIIQRKMRLVLLLFFH